MAKIWMLVRLEFKSLRLYGMQIAISLFVIPVSYMFVALLSAKAQGVELAYQLSGLAAAALIGSLISLLALRASNMMQAEILELYASLPVSTTQIILSLMVTYTVLAFPQVLIALSAAIILTGEFYPVLALAGLLLTIVSLNLIGVFLGLLIRNPFKAQGIMPLLSWFLLLASPLYYSTSGLGAVYSFLFSLNPVTHAMNLIRSSLGMPQGIGVTTSLLYLGVLSFILGGYFMAKTRKVYILEKLF